MVAGMFPGRLLGSELRHRKIEYGSRYGLHAAPPNIALCRSPDYVISCCNEAAMRRDSLRGQRPTAMYVSIFQSPVHRAGVRPVATLHSVVGPLLEAALALAL
jgi:hypothetical protein